MSEEVTPVQSLQEGMLVKHVELLKNCDHFVVRLPRQVREFPSTSISPMVRVIVGRPLLPGSFVADWPLHKNTTPQVAAPYADVQSHSCRCHGGLRKG